MPTGPERRDLLLVALPSGQVLEAAPDATIIVDERGSIAFLNSEAEALFGFPRDELLGQPIETLIPASRRGRHAELRRAYTETPHARPMGSALQIVAIRKDGSEFPADVKLSPLSTQVGLFVMAAVRDVSDRIHTEEKLRTDAEHLAHLKTQLEQQNIELERRNHELEQFAYVSSHDLQEPLRKIVAFGDRLRSTSGGALDARGLDYLTRMQGAARRMQRLINDLLEYSGITRKAAPKERVDLTKIASDARTDWITLIEETGARVEIGELGSIRGAAPELRALFHHLLGNALKFRREGVPPLVSIQRRDEGSATAIHFKDNGIGIEPKYTERIFTVFERLHPRERYDGTGIGLAMCKKIAERHGGSVTVESTPGEGSEFIVTLPRGKDIRSQG